MPRRRRTLLAALGGAAVGGLGWRTVLADPTALGKPPAKSDCPGPDRRPGGDGVDRVVCSRVGENPVRMALVGHERTNAAADARFDFRLTNTLPRTYDTNPYHWVVWKRNGDRWVRLYPRVMKLPLAHLQPGDGVEWTLRVTAGAPPMGGSGSRRHGDRLGALGAGEYAVANVGSFGDAAVRFAVRFSLEQPPVELVASGPTERNQYAPRWAVRRSTSGDVREVRVDPPWSGDLHVLRLSRTDEPPDRPPLLPEEAVRDWRFRHTIPLFEPGIREVRMRAPTRSRPPFRVREPRVRRYRGNRYRISTGWAAKRA